MPSWHQGVLVAGTSFPPPSCVPCCFWFALLPSFLLANMALDVLHVAAAVVVVVAVGRTL